MRAPIFDETDGNLKFPGINWQVGNAPKTNHFYHGYFTCCKMW